MRWLLVLSVALAIVVAGCGGGHRHLVASAPPPVTKQLRVVLQGALHQQASLALVAPDDPHYPDVRSCAGPGGAGDYRCTLTPLGGIGPLSLTVHVKPDGTWDAPLPRSPRDRQVVSEAVWGWGLRVPKR